MSLHTGIFNTSEIIGNKINLNDGNKIERPLLSVVIVVHLFIIIFGILGNSLIIYLVLFEQQLRNVRNAFMVNLTISNILLVTVCSPSFLVSISYNGWMMGKFWCKFLHSIQIVIILVSAFSIMMIAIDRWMFIVYSRSRQLKGKDVGFIVCGIWLISILLSVPMFMARNTMKLYDESIIAMIQDLNNKLESMQLNSTSVASTKNITFDTYPPIEAKPKFDSYFNMLTSKMKFDNPVYCYEEWSYTFYKRAYILTLFVLEFVLPCLAMLITYIWIIRFLKIQDDKMSNYYELLHKKLVQKEGHHRKNCKLLSVLCITFIICCLPLSFFNIKSEFDVNTMVNSDSFKDREIYSPLTILTTLEEMNTILSPLLYGWMNQNFRNVINEKINNLRKDYKQVQTSSNQKTNRDQLLISI